MSSDNSILFKFHQHLVQMILKKMCGETKTYNASISNGSTEEF